MRTESRTASVDAVVPAARLAFRGEQPFSLEFGDIYHAADGVAEVERVFLDPTRFAARAAHAGDWLRIGELGFGSGLNFVTAAERFLALAPAGARLHFVSCEARPIDGRAFDRLARERCRQQPLYAELARRYPPRLPGWHRRDLGGGRVRLSLYLGAAASALADLQGRTAPMHVWFLDGFAPDRNPALWSADLMHAVAALSAPGTEVATFTAAGVVRRRLEDAGFAVERLDQRPHKRHSLRGTFVGTPATTTAARPARPRRVVVGGAGLAGAFTAAALADAGIEVVVVDAAPGTGRLADAVLHGRVLTDGSPRARLRNNAYLGAAAAYASLGFAPCGALQFPSGNVPLARLERIAETMSPSGVWVRRCDAATASALAGVRVDTAGLFFADATHLPLDAVCETLLAAPRIERRDGRVEGTDWSRAGDAVVLCTATRPDLRAVDFLEVLPVAGQIDVVTTRARPGLPLFGDGYVLPRGNGSLAVGATYEQRAWPPERASAFNRARYARFWRTLTGREPAFTPHGTWRGVRGVSSDRQPVVGRVDAEGELWVNLAHGSNGTATAPLAAALIAERLGGEFAPLGRAEAALLDPARFRARQARRGPRHGAR